MTNLNVKLSREATALVESLMLDNPHPTNADWRGLIMNNPNLASEIADYSVWYSRSVHLDMDSYEEPLDSELFDGVSGQLMNALTSHEPVTHSADSVLNEIVGSRARTIANEIGLRSHVDLLDQLISGETKAPYILVKRLALKLGLEVTSLVQMFVFNFSIRSSQEFKSTGKPQLEKEPINWADAVRAAKLDRAETEYLLGLAREKD